MSQIKNMIVGLSKKQKILVVVTIVLAAALITTASVLAFSPYFISSTTNVPAGVPTPTPIPTATPTPTPTPTDTFTVTATLNSIPVADPTNINIPSGGYIGSTDIVVYTFTSTANQPITVGTSVGTGGVTGNEGITWDSTTVTNGYTVSLPSNGSTATMTMTVTLGTEGGAIPLIFTANP
jgi:hypothetical protein